jgi:hypothetical protein
LGAVETADDGLTGGGTGFQDGEAEDIEGFVGVPAELGAIDANEEDTVGDIGTGMAGSFGEARD